MMKQKYSNQVLENINYWLTASGEEVRDEMEPYFEMYRERFLEVLAACDINTNETVSLAVNEANQFQYVGDFLDDLSPHYSMLAAFGLVLFDRINSRWDEYDKSDIFFVHEQLFECFELASRLITRKTDARLRAHKGHAKRREAKVFVRDQWELYRQDYKGNKSAFARDYVKRVFNEYQIQVTEKQLREVWLDYSFENYMPSENEKLK